MIILLLFPYLAVVFTVGTLPVKERAGQMSPLEIYVCQITAGTLPADSADEFIKAQMVLVRTNAVREMQEQLQNPVENLLDIKSIEERFGDRLYRLAKETEGQILMHEGVPIEGAYHAVSNGKTRDGREVLGESMPYLVPVECPEDLRSPEYLYRTEILVEQRGSDPESGGVKWNKVEVLERDSSGYVQRVKFGEELLTGEQFRERLGLCSSDFIIEEAEDAIIITTKGLGHGLGMSQYTANHMAQNGAEYREILATFFPGTDLTKIE